MPAALTMPAPVAVEPTPVDSAMLDFATMRRAMIDSQLRPSDVTEPRLIAAIGAVAREDFVPTAVRMSSYTDRAIPLPHGRAINPPLTSARLIDAAMVQPTDRVLLIGAATGYTTAIVARLAAQVVAVECDAELAAQAQSALSGHATVTVVEQPLTTGAPDRLADGARYDVLIIDGAVPAVPTSLLNQLADGARIATGLIDHGVTRLARGVHIAGVDTVGLLAFVDYECVPLPGFTPPPRFEF